jgi:ABC-type oligopeptide transport system substrate-binding subunit
MKPSLYLFKKENGRSEYSMKTEVQIVVVDLDKSKKYPQNFVCILPQTAISPGRTPNIFSKVFGQDSLEVAKKLLHKALKSEQDDDIRKELQTRLKTLKTYPDQKNIFVA